MRRAARIAGLVWMALAVMGGAILWASETMAWAGPVSSNRGLIYIAFGAALPGIILYRWGRGSYHGHPSARDSLRRAYPPKTADEMGHVLQIKPD